MVVSDYKWNSIAALINASEAVIMSMILTRTMSVADAGVITIAFAIGNLFINIGKFGVGSYQVSDVNYRFTYGTYVSFRLLTVFFMLIVSVGYALYSFCIGHYSGYKAYVVLLMCVIYMIEAVEDVLWGEFQRRRRLDLGAKLFVCRWTVILIVFVITIIASRNLIVAMELSAISSMIALVIATKRNIYTYNLKSCEKFVVSNIRTNIKSIKILCKETYPLFISSFLTFYLNNAPKYALDRVVSDELQAYYGFVAMPIFVIGMLSSMLYQPKIVWLSEEWNKKQIDSFRRHVGKQMLTILLISVVCIMGSGILGIPVLSLIYGVDLSGYWNHLIILQFSGLFMALANYVGIVLTIMRAQNRLMIGYIITTIVSLPFLSLNVKNYGTIGAAGTYLFSMILLFLFYISMYLIIIKGCKKSCNQ